MPGLFEHLINASGNHENCPVEHGDRLQGRWIDTDMWVCFAIRNVGLARGTWRIDFDGVIGEGYSFRVVYRGEELQILTAPTERTMAQLETGGPWLASLPFAILPGETVEIWIYVNAATNLGTPLGLGVPRLVPEQVFDATANARQFVLGGHLTTSVLLTTLFLAFARLLSFRPAQRYAYYFMAATVSLIAYDGYLAALFPTIPVLWITAANRLVEMLMIVLYFGFLASFVRESIGAHRILSVARWFMWAVPGAVILGAVIAAAGEALKLDATAGTAETGALLGTVAPWIYGGSIIVLWTILSIWSAALLIRRGTDGAWLFAAGAWLLMLSPFVGAPALGWSDSGFLRTEIVRDILVLVDAVIFAAAMVRLTFGLRTQRDRATREALDTAREKLRLSEGLLAARKDLSHARGLAEQHRSRLALTGHDLRQPLLSLRLALDDDMVLSGGLREALDSSLDYLKTVLDQILIDTRPASAANEPAPQPNAETEAIPLHVILQNAMRMFRSEAEAKGLSIRTATTTAVVDSNPVALICIVSNLVSNAVKYTHAGGVLIGVRHRGGTLSVDIYDTGPGMSQDQVSRVRRSYRRGDAAGENDGEGLGLASVEDLARENGLTLTVHSRPGKGSRFSIEGLTALDSSAGFAGTLGPHG